MPTGKQEIATHRRVLMPHLVLAMAKVDPIRARYPAIRTWER